MSPFRDTSRPLACETMLVAGNVSVVTLVLDVHCHAVLVKVNAKIKQATSLVITSGSLKFWHFMHGPIPLVFTLGLFFSNHRGAL